MKILIADACVSVVMIAGIVKLAIYFNLWQIAFFMIFPVFICIIGTANATIIAEEEINSKGR